ncbi:MAG: hypothetical protein RBT74_10580 [Tenuifilaceae bacterium]|jgi:hypothetical protein|nr:hypothetical protein [Tenuifilaceae bacterium]
MESTVYIVKCSSGDWDDFRWWIGGIYTQKEDALKLKRNLDRKAKRIQGKCPVKKDLTDMSEEEEKLYYSYHSEHELWMDWNNATVEEVFTNKPL